MQMYNLLNCSSDYFERTESLWFYSKDEVTNFNADFPNDNFRSFEYKAKLLENTEADNGNGILKNATIVVPLKYVSSFQRPLEMHLINYKV